MFIGIKPLSVNQVRQWKRFKTKVYLNREAYMLAGLPSYNTLIEDVPMEVSIEFWFSNSACDIDNCVKPLFDVLQKKYKFNDKNIYKCNITKMIVKKWSEYVNLSFRKLETDEYQTLWVKQKNNRK